MLLSVSFLVPPSHAHPDILQASFEIRLVNPDLVKEWPPEIIQQAKSRIGTSTGIWFYTENIDTTFHELKSNQVDVTSPEKQIWEGVMSSVYDQDRNILGLVGDSK